MEKLLYLWNKNWGEDSDQRISISIDRQGNICRDDVPNSHGAIAAQTYRDLGRGKPRIVARLHTKHLVPTRIRLIIGTCKDLPMALQSSRNPIRIDLLYTNIFCSEVSAALNIRKLSKRVSISLIANCILRNVWHSFLAQVPGHETQIPWTRQIYTD